MPGSLIRHGLERLPDASALVKQLHLRRHDPRVLEDLEGHLELVGSHLPASVRGQGLTKARSGAELACLLGFSELATYLVFQKFELRARKKLNSLLGNEDEK